MFTRCLVCATSFEPNDQLEYLRNGTSVAFDPARGRLWAVCATCKRWSLTPIEDRWEALEELEKLTRDKARLLSQTDNIALLKAGPLEIVRVGNAKLTEEAWWRYGRELASRRQNYKKLSFAGTAAAGAVVVGGWASGGMTLLGMWFIMGYAPDSITDAARWLRFGGSAWRGARECQGCGYTFRNVPYRGRGSLGIFPGGENGKIELVQPCPVCGHYKDGGLHLTGKEADRILRRVLAYHHFAGASERRVISAAKLIQLAGSPQDLTRIVVKEGRRIGDLQRTGAIALEIAANESAEHKLLELELAQLETHWKEEEELAAIIDGELTPLPLIESLRRQVTGRG